MIFVSWDYSRSTLKDRHCNRETSPKSDKAEISTLANRGTPADVIAYIFALLHTTLRIEGNKLD